SCSVVHRETLADLVDPLVQCVEARMQAAVVQVEHVADHDEAKDPVVGFHIREDRLDGVADPYENSRQPFHRIPSLVQCRFDEEPITAGQTRVGSGEASCRATAETSMPSVFETAPAAKAIPIT